MVIEAIQVRLGRLGLIALVPEVCGKYAANPIIYGSSGYLNYSG